MKKKESIMWIVMFAMLLIVFPLVLLFKYGQSDENQEYRVKVSLEDIKAASLPHKLEVFEKYYEDNCPGRDKLIRLKSKIDLELLKMSPSDDIVIGQDGWMFYEDSVSWYTGQIDFDDDDMKAFCDKLTELESNLAQNGGHVVLLIAPNKETVYGEYLPDSIKRIEDKTEKLMGYLADSGIDAFFFDDELNAYKDKFQLYAKRDSHWNSIGAYITAYNLLKAEDSALPPIEELEMYAKPYEGEDLARQINMANVWEPELDYDYIGYGMNRSMPNMYEWDINGDGLRYHTDGATEKSVYIIRDSFFNEILPFISIGYSDVFVRHINNYEQGEVYNENPDLVILELGERRLSQLLNFEF